MHTSVFFPQYKHQFVSTSIFIIIFIIIIIIIVIIIVVVVYVYVLFVFYHSDIKFSKNTNKNC